MSDLTPPHPKPESLTERLKKQGLTLGRIVEYVTVGGEPRAALVTHVHTATGYADAGAVNLCVFDRGGQPYAETEVPLEGAANPTGPAMHFWRWPKRAQQ